jgi:predicted nucleic acid-binding protein
MILADTSVWIDHLRSGNDRLASLLEEGSVLSHPFVVGEIACGALRRRAEVLAMLRALPQAVLAQHDEVLRLLDAKRLHGKGLGWIDAHLLAASLLGECLLWTLDKPLVRQARSLGVAF